MPPPRPRHGRAAPCQARQQVIQLRQFHLQAPFAGPGARGENIENQRVRSMILASTAFSRLRCWVGVRSWSKITRSAAPPAAAAASSRTLPGPIERGGFRGRSRLHHPLDDLGARAGGQFRQLFQRFFRGQCAVPAWLARAFPVQPDQNRAFPAGVRLCRVLGLRRFGVRRRTGHAARRAGGGRGLVAAPRRRHKSARLSA